VGASVLYPPSFYDNTDVTEIGEGAPEISITPNCRLCFFKSHTFFFWIWVGRLLKFPYD
jgi:hypothetical protein